MLVKVKGYGLMKEYTSHLSPDGELEIREGVEVGAVLALLKVPGDSSLVLLINGRPATMDHLLQPGDALVFFPPLEGG